MTYDRAIQIIRKPGHFNPITVNAACEFMYACDRPTSVTESDHQANRNQSFVVRCANYVPHYFERM